MNEGWKGVFESRTILSVAAGMLCKVMAIVFHVSIDSETERQVAELLSVLVSFVCDAGAVYGRMAATKKIGGGGAGKGESGHAVFGVLAVIALAGLAACASFQTTEDCLRKTAAAEMAVTAAYQDTGRLLSSGLIDAGAAKKALKLADAANALTDRARPLCGVDSVSAGTVLSQAAGILLDVKKVLGE